MKTFLRRVGAVLTWDSGVYDEVAADPGAIAQAAALVFLSGLASDSTSGWVSASLVGGATLIFWGIAAFILHFVGTRMPKPAPSMAELLADAVPEEEVRPVGVSQVLRATGFAYAPQFVANLVLIPAAFLALDPFLELLQIGVSLWVTGAYVYSISTVFDITIWRAIFLSFASFIVLMVAFFVIAFLFFLANPR